MPGLDLTNNYRNVMNIRIIRDIYVLILTTFACIACEKTYPDVYDYQTPDQLDDGWETASLNSVGMDSLLIEQLVNSVYGDHYRNVHSIVIIKDGKLVFEEYWPGNDFGMNSKDYLGKYIEFDRDTRHNTHSATKSITSMVVGIASDKGYMSSEEDFIFNYLPDHTSFRTGGREKITIRHMLTMSSGLQWNEWDVSVSESNHDIIRFNQSANPVSYLLSKPLVTEPGTTFYYNGGGVDLLGQIVKNATGEDIKAFSKTNLFSRLGITNYYWQTLSPSGITCCHGDIYITPRDMAKLGYLFLNDGIWNGTSIISSEWISKSVQNHISPGVSWADGYGYLWWLRNYHSGGITYSSYRAEGWGGQMIIVIPDEELVVVFTGANYVTGTPCEEIISEYILPSLK